MELLIICFANFTIVLIRFCEIHRERIYEHSYILSYYIGYRQIIITSTWSDSRVISKMFGVSNATQEYIYYFQWEYWQRTIPIYDVFDCKIFKSFSLHCLLILTILISLNYFEIYIIQETNFCIDSFTFYLYRYHLFLVSICHRRY